MSTYAATATVAPEALAALVERFDAAVFDARARRTRVRLAIAGAGEWDAVIAGAHAELRRPAGDPDAILSADADTWLQVAEDPATALAAYRSGRLSVRRNLHVGIGFLAATSGESAPDRLRQHSVRTSRGRLSVIEAGSGETVLALHGLGATKVSLLPTVLALRGGFRVIAVDQPGFGDSDKPIGAPYDAPYLARAATALLDELGIDRAHVVGNSLGGRVALEMGLAHPDRVRRLGLLAPSLAWLRSHPLRPLVRLARPELGLVQLAPRRFVEAFVQRAIPQSRRGWTAAGVDEFVRAFTTPSGRAAFYAAARHIMLEAPHGDGGFWTRLPELEPDALFVWGRNDQLVPLGFARHVEERLPQARHLELDCGHVPQLERPQVTHREIQRFLSS